MILSGAFLLRFMTGAAAGAAGAAGASAEESPESDFSDRTEVSILPRRPPTMLPTEDQPEAPDEDEAPDLEMLPPDICSSWPIALCALEHKGRSNRNANNK